MKLDYCFSSDHGNEISTKEMTMQFRKAVEERFICLLCQNVALNPVANTPCGHPMCGKCSAQMKAKATGYGCWTHTVDR
jgi:hypothetical protein